MIRKFTTLKNQIESNRMSGVPQQLTIEQRLYDELLKECESLKSLLDLTNHERSEGILNILSSPKLTEAIQTIAIPQEGLSENEIYDLKSYVSAAYQGGDYDGTADFSEVKEKYKQLHPARKGCWSDDIGGRESFLHKPAGKLDIYETQNDAYMAEIMKEMGEVGELSDEFRWVSMNIPQILYAFKKKILSRGVYHIVFLTIANKTHAIRFFMRDSGEFCRGKGTSIIKKGTKILLFSPDIVG